MTLAPAAPIGQRIDESYGDLSPQEQRAADFILDHLADLAVYNASELARLSGVSKATVSRLFRSLGFSDAQEVRDHARALRNQGVPIGGISLGEPQAEGGLPAGTSAALNSHIEQELSNIRTALLAVTDGRVAEAARILAAARRVVVIGLRNSYPVALHLRQQLIQGLDDVRLAPQPAQSIGEELAGLGPEDAVVIVGFRRRPSGFTRVVDAVRHRAVPLVLIADSSAGRFADDASVWLDCPVDSVSALDSYAAANSLVALLASETLGVAATGSRTRISSINRLYGDLGELEPTV
ncbi:MurR/RpiR family transcriptional regulator [Subtercola frigoramans]|uniref:DNA-binding MurR/RpiR family transcriptional regulator n=1 Tax=Subtercola frigoramans TaxID=120298 RepID=A0ABS2L791_9MICO|nr:MurR/RpiR family transcriptional regulator [Subtercola frigoramans]MBM7472937.1 DNA-binding MurR/RpiR family transcriptional regulator [Subtercola frigoramans]